MASQASVSSSQPDHRQLRLIAAAAQANEGRLRDILDEDPPWTSTTDHDALRQALQKVAARGKLSLVRFLLDHGAEVNTRKDNEVPAIVKAAEGGHAFVVKELLARNANPNWRNTRTGQTAVFSSCLKGYNTAARVLLDGGAKVDPQDKEGRTPLLFLASEKQGKRKWTLDTPRLLLEKGANVEVRDHIGRTPLLWAATNGDLELARVLLDAGASVSASNSRAKTALHLAADSNHKELVSLLLSKGAAVGATSDGGWTALHNAAEKGYADVVNLLLNAGACVNAQLTNGMAPLHWAAYQGREDVVRLILSKEDVDLTLKDAFNRTPWFCAAEKYHSAIVQLLSPARAADRLSPVAEAACKQFEATIVDFGQFNKQQFKSKHSVYEVLYGWDHKNDRPSVPTLTKNVKYQPDFRWIHLPSNNIAWVETLLAKSFIEAGHRDIEGFKALEKCFDQEHCGHFAHAHFMRTFCQRFSSVQSDDRDAKEDKQLDALHEDASEVRLNSWKIDDVSTPKSTQETCETGTLKSDAKKKKRGEQMAERHPKSHKRGRGPPSGPHRRQSSLASTVSAASLGPLAWQTSSASASNGKIVLFMPFLHFETDERRKRMSQAIRNAIMTARDGRDPPHPQTTPRDDLLVHAYLKNTPPLHTRRTLDQFFYHGIDTSTRDADQVVYRYCKRNKMEPKVFMVDQLWLWVIGKDLVISCFPQRWDQPKQDPLNVLDGIIEETNAKTRPPIQSAYDLAMLITNHCAGMFGRHHLDDQECQFFDMFESSIGFVTHQETELFNRFYRASANSAQLLRRQRRRREGDPGSEKDITTDQLTDALLDIGTETKLLAEIKDIRDELNILAIVLESQVSALTEFEDCISNELRGDLSKRASEGIVADVRRRSREQLRRLEVHKNDIRRMDRQALDLYTSLRDLLDLKQKHSNALEARFAGEQAVIAAKQGRTIMVFTIVTIIFLPMSFIAAFFAINLKDWGEGLTAAYVSKYMFGIGLGISIPLIAMAFAINDISSAALGMFTKAHRKLVCLRPGRNKHEDLTEASVLEKTADVFSLRERPPVHYARDELPGTYKRQMDELPTFMRPSHDRHDYYANGRLSPVSGSRTRARKLSPNSGASVSFARASVDRSRYADVQNIRRGERGGSPSRWV